VVIVTVFDPNADKTWIEKVKENREEYAKKHGYLTFFPNNNQYPIGKHPLTWAKVPALRHAMTLHPSSTFFWYLDNTALIMNTNVPVHSAVLAPHTLEKLMIANQPIVPPDSVIKTFSNLKGERIDLVVTQDHDGLSTNSIIVRNGEWAKYFLDAWFDPIYRNYNFQKAETHALEHIVQWHGTLLAKLALIPQNALNSYAKGAASENGQYKPGDLVSGWPGCDKDANRHCEEEMQAGFDTVGKQPSDG
jgi:mannan polymerase II complex MNN11 subunit